MHSKRDGDTAALNGTSVAALIACQVGLHGCLIGARMAVPLQALQQGRTAAAIGLLLALFAVLPVVLAIPAGRMADRLGYHRPVYLALALSALGATVGAVSDHLLALCIAASFVGAGASIGMIALQRTAGRLAVSSADRLRVFSWVALAPSIANFVGPLVAGGLIDHAGFRATFAGLALLPVFTLLATFLVPPEASRVGVAMSAHRAGPAWDLVKAGDFRRLLLINWLIAACWDAHSFALPILGHERGLSATAIGAVLGAYAVTSASVRLLIPTVAHWLSPRILMCVALSLTSFVFWVYPLMQSAWAMAACTGALGLGLGAIQPSVMTTLHQVTPSTRLGEAAGLRSTLIHLSTLVMPLAFGALGSALGVAPVFWLTGAALSAGAWQALRLPAASS